VTLLRPDQMSTFDVVLDGWGYVLDELDPNPYQLQCQDDALEKTSIDTQLEMNKLDTLYWGANRSWHEGQGQTRLDVPPRFQIDPSTASSPYKHLRSKGVDITTRGQITLLHRTAKGGATLVNQDPSPQKIATTDLYAYVTNGLNVVRSSDLFVADNTVQATGSAQNAVDIATDGGVTYVACGTDGIYRATSAVGGETQREAADSLTNWAVSGTGATIQLDTGDKKEGTASVRMNLNVGQGTMTKTFAAPIDFSAVNLIKFWMEVGNAGVVEVRLQTSGGNFYSRLLTLGTETWTQDVTARTDWAAFGSPNWNSIAAWVIVSTAPNVEVLVDDLRTVVTSSFASWGTWDARVLGWANDQLFAAGIKTGTQWRVYKAAATTTGAELYVLPDGWAVTSIRALGGLVYFSAYRGGKGVIYVYDGQNPSLTIACPWDALGNGTIPLTMIPFSGAGMLIGCRRLTTTASAGLGVLYRGFPDAVGSLRLERVAIHGADDGRDYGIRCGIAYGDFAYFGMNYGDEPTGENFLVDTTKRTGLGIYWPETGGWGRSYLTPTGAAVSGIVEDAAVFKGRRIFTVGGVGVYVEQATYEPEGGVQTSLIDVNVSADKVWLAEESYYSATEAITSPVSHAYSLDGSSWLNDTGGGGAGSSIRVRTSFATLALKTPSIYARTRLTTTSGTVTPVLLSTGIGGYPATKPLPIHALMIRAYPSAERLDISRTHARHDGWAVLGRLITLWQNQSIVDYQPPWAFADPTQPNGISYKVRVAQVQATKGWNATGDATGGIASVQLKVCP
jgi:hypothetical protein